VTQIKNKNNFFFQEKKVLSRNLKEKNRIKNKKMSKSILQTLSLLLLLVSSLFCFVEISAQQTTSAPPTTAQENCFFQFRFFAANSSEMTQRAEAIGRDREKLYRNLLQDTYPDLVASLRIQFQDVTFNVSKDMNYTGGGGATNAKPRAGCKHMLETFNTTDYRETYHVGKDNMWESDKYSPSHVPHWLRTPADPPTDMYIALGATSAVLILVQVGYGLYHSYVHRGTLESVGTD
jgi:hypothetical protein